jgi:hypothetical protein
MTPSGGLRSVCVSSSPPVTTPTGRLAPACSRPARRRFPAPGVVLRTAARATVALPTGPVRLRDQTYGSVPTIGSAAQTR